LIEQGQEALEERKDHGQRKEGRGIRGGIERRDALWWLKDGKLPASDWQGKTHRPFKCLLEATHFI
jgi:hypothetical protein